MKEVFFFKFITYSWETEREREIVQTCVCMSKEGEEWEWKRESQADTTLSAQSLMSGHELWDHDLNQNQESEA